MLMRCISIEQSLWNRKELVDVTLTQETSAAARVRFTLPCALAEGYVVGGTYDVPAPIRVAGAQ